jgi:L-alanine-DL-glutamate epimerase-like enolase superfamily enzyme
VPVYGSGGFTSYPDEHLREQLLGWTDVGIPRVKIKIGESWGTRTYRDLARACLARQIVGDDVELYVDANGGYSPGQAVRVGRALGDLGVRWFEEPVSSDDPAGLAHVRAAVEADVAAGEYVYRLADARQLVQGAVGGPVVDCLQIDVSRCGGVTEWRRIAALAAAFGLDVSAHCAPALHLHVAAATANVRHLEWFHDHVRFEGALFDGVPSTAGGVLRPDLDRPGIGMTLRPDAADRIHELGTGPEERGRTRDGTPR